MYMSSLFPNLRFDWLASGHLYAFIPIVHVGYNDGVPYTGFDSLLVGFDGRTQPLKMSPLEARGRAMEQREIH